MKAKRPAKPRKILYKIVGMCRMCKTRFVVDKSKGHFSGNYCPACVKKFYKGGRSQW